jgi:hypothetical protein
VKVKVKLERETGLEPATLCLGRIEWTRPFFTQDFKTNPSLFQKLNLPPSWNSRSYTLHYPICRPNVTSFDASYLRRKD